MTNTLPNNCGKNYALFRLLIIALAFIRTYVEKILASQAHTPEIAVIQKQRIQFRNKQLLPITSSRFNRDLKIQLFNRGIFLSKNSLPNVPETQNLLILTNEYTPHFKPAHFTNY